MKLHWPRMKKLIGRPSLKESRRTGAKRRVGHKYFNMHNKIMHETNYCLCMLNPSWFTLPKILTSTIILVSHGHIAINYSLIGHNNLCTFKTSHEDNNLCIITCYHVVSVMQS